MPARRLDPALIREARALITDGHSQHAAARKLGISQSGLSKSLSRAVGEAPLHDSDVTPDYTEIPVIHRDYSHLDELKLYPFGDVHLGSPAHDAEKWAEWLGYLKDQDNASMIGTGDFLNSAIKTSVSDVYEETSPVGEAKRLLWHQLEPIKDRIDVLIQGNHERRIYNAVGDCPIHDVADFLGVPYVRDACMVVYQVGEVPYSVYLRHGTGGGQVGARAGRLQRQSQTILADVYISGHSHSQLCFPEEIFRYDPALDRVVRDRRYFVASGSWLRYEGYAAANAYAPGKIGAPRISLNGTRKDCHVSI